MHIALNLLRALWLLWQPGTDSCTGNRYIEGVTLTAMAGCQPESVQDDGALLLVCVGQKL